MIHPMEQELTQLVQAMNTSIACQNQHQDIVRLTEIKLIKDMIHGHLTITSNVAEFELMWRLEKSDLVKNARTCVRLIAMNQSDSISTMDIMFPIDTIKLIDSSTFQSLLDALTDRSPVLAGFWLARFCLQNTEVKST